MTRYNLPPADDPSSIESFLRVRRSQLPGGRPPIRGTREAAERRSAEHDAERILDLLHRLPADLYLEGETNGNRQEVRYRWLRHHGYERRRVDAALAAAWGQLARRVHVATDPITAAGGGRHDRRS